MPGRSLKEIACDTKGYHGKVPVGLMASKIIWYAVIPMGYHGIPKHTMVR